MAIQSNPNIPHMPPASSPAYVPGTPAWVQPIIEKASKTHNIPTIILSALLKQESGFQPHVSSPAGAQGIAQFMPGTAQGMGVNPWDPESSINGAAQYLKNAYDKFGKMDLALASYNAGTGAVEKYGGIPPYKETQNYVKNILSMAGEPHSSYNQPYLSFVQDLKDQSPKIGSGPTSVQPNQLAFTQKYTNPQPPQPSMPQPSAPVPDFSSSQSRLPRMSPAVSNQQLQDLYNPNGGQLLSNLT